ncbi:MAG: protein involved in methylthiolation of isopentenylated A37 derivatives in tRNA [Candidatus Gottesmanbacteria bacterium GW2011_GWC2_39_8]|uniref:Protein involved in methylthiolation of isopentenylated A37 derivatives in tRNA n=1 Tax=Candidatus Gottesmanbacteria bacterium GW2011_GWC2_39_8 TaxID=1618450 RepID=A0A0G0PYL2_9BACT|nr:MAG: protein involved in methylthiolation of isopentenylated A37 derivatives in tRNA [Candidatus Gottesmanbacteria bacterium GW2011_GWC2_39_8]
MGSHYNGLNLGIDYIASFLNQNGHEVIIYNADFQNDTNYLDQRKLFENFNQYKTILDDKNHSIWKEVREVIKDVKPDFIGIKMYTGTFKSAQNVAEIAKELNPEIKIIAGGTHPTLDPIGTMKTGVYDYVVRGEGEYTVLELMNGIDAYQIKGITFKNREGENVNNADRGFIENLDSLPFPQRDNYYSGNDCIDVGSIITSRGCPFQCTYCASPQIWDKKTRYRGVDNVLEELEYMTNSKGVSLIRFQDDTFTLNKKRAMEILDGILSKGLNIKWVCDTRVDKLDKEVLQIMKKSGCIRVKIGVESGSDEILKRVKKGISLEQIRNAVKLIKEIAIPLTAYFMIGFPGETDDDVRKTIQFAEEINADYNSLSVIAPYFGTQVYNDLEQSGFEFDKHHWEYFYHQSKAMILNTGISRHLINEFFALNDKGKGKRV